MISISRKDLYDRLWSIGITKTANDLNAPYNKLKKACVNNDIPLPTASYWSKLHMGNEKPVQPPLPRSEDNRIVSIEKAKKQRVTTAPKKIITTDSNKGDNEITKVNAQNLPIEMKELHYFSYLESEQKNLTVIYNSLKINENLSTKPHKEILKYRKKTKSYREDRLRIKSASGEIFPEVLPFIDSLFKALEKAGAKIICKFDETEVIFKKYTFTLNFKLPCKKVNLTPEDKNYSTYHTFEYETKGTINVEVGYKAYWYRWSRNEKVINQTKTMSVEDLLRKVFIYIFSLTQIIDEEEKAHIIAEEKRLKEEKERILLRERQENEYKRTQDLLNNSMNYFYSKIIKEYISSELDESTDEYQWAMNKANWIQDSSKHPDDLLTENEKRELLDRKMPNKYIL
ncbi:hypothetical protein [Oceanobacillus bengalensis]|uniref:Uncharacterized protein n=1 Tax=Oceanobacillus bengalensis TaxID=1435466 RepID=A0A494YTA7_9BACI|nr:hypothetical protein [Oceanobacillus bengalensis]RKQ13358.1 hypothetical protein D8M05_16450 [Oceanobacillus bengalensis]